MVKFATIDSSPDSWFNPERPPKNEAPPFASNNPENDMNEEQLPKPVNIHELLHGQPYFVIAVEDEIPSQYLTFIFKSKGIELDKDRDVSHFIYFASSDENALPNYARENKISASVVGLLHNTEIPVKFGDNHWRTFPFTQESYRFFEMLVANKDYDAYKRIVGKRERQTAAQQVREFLLNMEYAVLSKQRQQNKG